LKDILLNYKGLELIPDIDFEYSSCPLMPTMTIRSHVSEPFVQGCSSREGNRIFWNILKHQDGQKTTIGWGLISILNCNRIEFSIKQTTHV